MGMGPVMGIGGIVSYSNLYFSMCVRLGDRGDPMD